MAQPIWITPAGSLGTIPEGIFYQTNMLADTATITTVTCTATSSATNLITCDSTANIWPGLNLIFSGGLFGGVSPSVRYFVLAVPDSTHFSIAPFEYSTTPIALTNGSGSMTATFNQHVLFTIQAGSLPSGIQIADNGLIEGVPKAVASMIKSQVPQIIPPIRKKRLFNAGVFPNQNKLIDLTI
jgi:hypothetical protein